MATIVRRTNPDGNARIDQELRRLADTNLALEDFFQRFLSLALQTLGGSGGAAWGLNQSGMFAKICGVGDSGTGESNSASPAARHVQSLLKVLHSGQADLLLPGSANEDGSAARPVLLVTPLRSQGDCIGVIEITLPSGASAEHASVQLARLVELSEYASRYVVSLGRTEPTADHPEFFSLLEQFALGLHRQVGSRRVALTAANEGRLVLGCDRVGVFVRRGREAHLLAISGQDRVAHRSNLIRSMTKVATQTLVTGEAITYSGSMEDYPPQVEKPLIDYLAESDVRQIDIIPLYEPPVDDDSNANKRPSALGVLLVEQLSGSQRSATLAGIEKLAAHIAQALHNARTQEKIFLLPVRRAIGSCFALSAREKTTKFICVVTVLAVSLLALSMIPVPYRVEAEGNLTPVAQRRVFAPQDAEVMEVLVEGGQQVAQGQPLLRLRNNDLSMRVILIRNQLIEKQKLLRALEATDNEARGPTSREELIRLQGRISKTQIEMNGLRQQLAALITAQSELQINSPISGTITTFEPRQLLIGRPVQRGEMLIEVVNENETWQLELEVPAHRLGHIRAAQESQHTKSLPVQFILATMPEQTFTGNLEKLSTRTALAPDGSSVISAHVAVDVSRIADRTVGAEVVARIHCGRKSLAYVLFGDLVEFVQKRIW